MDELLQAMNDLSVGRSTYADGKGGVRSQGSGEAAQNGEGGVRGAGRAPLEGEVEGNQLNASRARGPGEGEATRDYVSGGPHHAVPPQAVRKEGKSKAVWGAGVGRAMDPKDRQIAPNGSCG